LEDPPPDEELDEEPDDREFPFPPNSANKTNPRTAAIQLLNITYPKMAPKRPPKIFATGGGVRGENDFFPDF
jgi:hypothetical protein